MDCMTGEELEDHAILILNLKKIENPCPQKNLEDFG